MSNEQPQQFNVKMTIPQIRVAMLEQINAIELLYGASNETEMLRLLVDETKRRTPTYKVARSRHPDPDPEMIKRIREIKAANPEISHLEIGTQLQTSTRCVSLALSGRRDGTPVFDPNGVKIKRKRTKAESSPSTLGELEVCLD